jgi:nitrate reductase gamma subunit
MTFLRLLLACSILWAILALTAQVISARAGGRRDYSRPTGSPWRGIWYNFTTAMLPWHKESARLHAAEFAIGILLHVGVLLSLAAIVALLVKPAAGEYLLSTLWPLNLASLAAGLFLLIRRVNSKLLRAISSPDDYIAPAMTCGLLAMTVAFALTSHGPVPLFVYATVLFAYFPLGKLRHAVFFFVARADYGRRLGYRGVYPPAPELPE